MIKIYTLIDSFINSITIKITSINRFYNKLSLSLLFFFFLLLVLLTFTGNGGYITYLNIHDIWMGHIAGNAILHDLTPDVDIYSGLGIIYFYINYISLLIVEYSKGMLNYIDLYLLSSLIFIIIFVPSFVFLTYKDAKFKLNAVYLIVGIITIAFTLRTFNKPFNTTVSWHAIYNKQLWVIVFIQIMGLFYKCKNKSKLTTVTSFTQALLLFIIFNFKFTTFIPAAMISCCYMLLATEKKELLMYIIKCFCFFMLFIGITSLLGYSYYNYFSVLIPMFEAKKVIPLPVAKTLICFVPVYLVFLVSDYNTYKKKSGGIKNYFFKNRSFWIFSVVFSATTLIKISDGQGPHILSILPFFLYWIIVNNNIRLYKNGSICFFIIFISINLFTIGKISYYKYFNSDYVETSIKIPNGKELKFILTANDFDNNVYPDNRNELQLATFKMNKPVKSSRYYEQINYSLNIFNKININKNDKILMLEFVNILPFLLKTSYPLPIFHWFHEGHTFSYDNYGAVTNNLNVVDFVYLPAYHEDGLSQIKLNCAFYEWNSNKKRFILFHVANEGLFYASHNMMNKYGLNKADELKYETVNNECLKVSDKIVMQQNKKTILYMFRQMFKQK